MKRTEQRYLVSGYATLFRHLCNASFAHKSYMVHTTYLDFDPPTWSVGNGSKKYRIRWYNNNPAEMYFETKLRKDDHVTKRRRKLNKTSWFGLKSIAHVSYFRHEYSSADGDLRVTIDTEITSPNRPEPLGIVVEVKSKSGVIPDWLVRALPPSEAEFSKSKWVTGCWKAKQS